MVSLLNGLGGFGTGLGAFAGKAIQDEADKADATARQPLINATPTAPVESTPPPVAAEPTVESPSSTAAKAGPPNVALADIHPDLTTVTSPGGVKLTVAKSAADKFLGLVTDLEQAGYKIDPATSGGYNPRLIAGTNTPSMHAHGLAVDVNWHSNARGENTPSDLPPDLARALATKYGLTWGGDWHGNTRDPMHFEAGMGT